MKTLLLATVTTAALAFPTLAQNQSQPAQPAPTQAQSAQPGQTQPNQTQNQSGQSAQTSQPQAGASSQASMNTQAINPSTLSKDQIKQLQAALDKNGFQSGKEDGVFGPETRRALEKFEKSKGMTSTNGELDQQALSGLGLDTNQFGQGAMGSPNQRMQGAATNMTGSTAGASTASQQNGRPRQRRQHGLAAAQRRCQRFRKEDPIGGSEANRAGGTAGLLERSYCAERLLWSDSNLAKRAGGVPAGPDLFSEAAVTAVAEGRVRRLLAAAEPDLLGLLRREWLRRHADSLMRPVAERLVRRSSAGAPVVGLAGLDHGRVGPLLGDDRV